MGVVLLKTWCLSDHTGTLIDDASVSSAPLKASPPKPSLGPQLGQLRPGYLLCLWKILALECWTEWGPLPLV